MAACYFKLMKLNKFSNGFENKQELLKQQNTVAISQGLLFLPFYAANTHPCRDTSEYKKYTKHKSICCIQSL